jgi:hypothetical protein
MIELSQMMNLGIFFILDFLHCYRFILEFTNEDSSLKDIIIMKKRFKEQFGTYFKPEHRTQATEDQICSQRVLPNCLNKKS